MNLSLSIFSSGLERSDFIDHIERCASLKFPDFGKFVPVGFYTEFGVLEGGERLLVFCEDRCDVREIRKEFPELRHALYYVGKQAIKAFFEQISEN